MRRNNSYVLEHIIDSWEKLIEKLFHDRNDVCQQVANCVDNWAQWIAGCLSRYSACLKFHFKIFIFSTIKSYTNNSTYKYASKKGAYSQSSKRCHFSNKMSSFQKLNKVSVDVLPFQLFDSFLYWSNIYKKQCFQIYLNLEKLKIFSIFDKIQI